MFLRWKRGAAARHGQDFWEQHAQHDPLWAILSDPTKKGRKWDLPAFFETGAREISIVLYRLAELDLEISRKAALDFGCGVGRLTQALGAHFDQAVGVDISPTMIRLAEKLNRHPGRVRYLSNSREDLSIFDASAFDFIYSDIVLQHVPPASTRKYLPEFVRILKKGGVLVFQLPSHPRPAGEQGPGAKPMPESAYRARIELHAPPQTAPLPSSEMSVRGTVTNISNCSWTLENGPIKVGNHWLDAREGTMLVQDDGRVLIPSALGPGGTFDFELKMKAPARGGNFRCEIDLVHEAVCWFADRGSKSESFFVRVGDRFDAPAAGVEPARDEGGATRQVTDADIYADLPPEVEDLGGIPMFSIGRDEVVELLSSQGAQVVHVEEDGNCGREWVGYRYFVRK
jgi:SAM-dependent methyltransferase